MTAAVLPSRDLGNARLLRARRRAPEHALQVRIKAFVRECVDVPHLFLAFDRSRKQSRLQHVREAARGIRAGTPDTLLIAAGIYMWCELKAPGGRLTEAQVEIGHAISQAGGFWGVAHSVEDYHMYLARFGVPLRRIAPLRAAHHDAVLAGREMRRKGLVARPVRRA